MNDDHHYGARPISLGTFPGRNRPIDINQDTHAYGWRLFTVFMFAANLSFIVFAVWGVR